MSFSFLMYVGFAVILRQIAIFKHTLKDIKTIHTDVACFVIRYNNCKRSILKSMERLTFERRIINDWKIVLFFGNILNMNMLFLIPQLISLEGTMQVRKGFLIIFLIERYKPAIIILSSRSTMY